MLDRSDAGGGASVGASIGADSNVRTQYQALVDRFPDLLRDLGTTIAPERLRDLGVLMAAMEHFDRVLDATPHPAERAALSRAAVALLEHDKRLDAGAGSLDRALIESLQALRSAAVRRGVSAEIAAVTAETLANTERMRVAADRASYLACVEREGELCVELVLLIAQLQHPPAIAFLRAIATPANLLDKLVDLRGDHRRGEVAVDPGVRTHVALAVRLVHGAWRASRLHPSRLGFTAWGARWFVRVC